MNIYVGSLSYDVTDAELRQAFEAFGQVATAEVMRDGVSGRSRGFA
ncbi:MAG: RNA recognition motif domain-containing protein, partial [Terriglobia bacterium]